MVYNNGYAIRRRAPWRSPRARMRRARSRFPPFQRGNRAFRKAFRKGNVRAGGVLKPELKWYDNDQVDALGITIPATLTQMTPTTSSLNTIGQGNGSQQRIGDKAIVRAIQLNAQIKLTGQTSTSFFEGPVTVRLIMGIDHQCNGAMITAADILTDPTNIRSYRNMTTTARVSGLMDKTYQFNPQQNYRGVVAQEVIHQTTKLCKFYKKMSLLTQFDATGADAVASLTTNNIFFFAMTDAAVPIVKLFFDTRTRFVG